MILFYPLCAFAAGFFLDLIFGDPHKFPHIVRLIGGGISFFEKKFYCNSKGMSVRKSENKNVLRGFMFTLCNLFVWTVPFTVILFFAYKYFLVAGFPLVGFLLETFLCYQIIAVKDLRVESNRVFTHLKSDDIKGAKGAVSMIVGRDTQKLDRAGIIRAAVETVAENSSDGACAPLFFIALGGTPLGLFYKVCNTMDSMVAYKNERYLFFGRTAALLDDALNFIPSRLCALCIIASSFILNLFKLRRVNSECFLFDTKKAYCIWRRDNRNHSSPNSAQTEAAAAGALGLRLAGPAFYEGKLEDKPYIGDECRQIESEDIVRVNELHYTASILMFIIAIGVRFCTAVIFTHIKK